MPPDRLPIGTGNDRGPSYPQPVDMVGGGVPNGIWGQVSSSSFSLWSHFLLPQKAHNELPERTHPDRLTIIRRTTKGDSAEANGKDRGGLRRDKSGKQQQQKSQEIQDVIDPPLQPWSKTSQKECSSTTISLALSHVGHFLTSLFLTPYLVLIKSYIFYICTYL